MKKIILTSFLTFFSLYSLIAQTPCDGGRYSSTVFSNFTKTSNIQFGQNNSFTGANYDLKLDFYEPSGDTVSYRPLIIWAHGGSFLGGSKTDPDVVELAERFSKRGYVCASVNYRTGFFPIDSANAVKAVVRAVQDMKASIRFFYKDRKDGNDIYGIDTNNIFIGGSSAGGITALHIAYLDSTCKISDYLNNTMITNLQGLDGNSGHPCYSSKVHGVLNGAGALARYAWMEDIHAPLCSVHGTNDNVVKYNRGVVNPGVPLMYLDGSRMLHEQADAIGLENSFYTFYGAGHVPYALSSANMDTTENFYADFLAQRLGCANPGLQPSNTPSGSANLYPVSACTGNLDIDFCTGSNINDIDLSEVLIYPVPAKEYLYISIENGNHFEVQILSLDGRKVLSQKSSLNDITIDVSSILKGNYLIKIHNIESNNFITKKISIQ